MGRERRYPYLWGLTKNGQALFSCHQIRRRKCESPHQLSYVTHSNSGEGLLFFGNVTIPFVDRFPKNTKLYSIMTTRPEEKEAQNE